MIESYQVLMSNLPFKPVRGQVIYVDFSNDKEIDAFIVKNYLPLRAIFSRRELEFCYLPRIGDSVLSYYAPYLDEKQRDKIIAGMPSLASYVRFHEIEPNRPSLVYSLSDVDDTRDVALNLIPIPDDDIALLFDKFIQIAKKIEHDLSGYDIEEDTRESFVAESPTRFRLEDKGPTLYRSCDDSDELLAEFRQRINDLRNRGVNTMFLHRIIDESEHVSPLHITSDYRIILPDYNNLEVTMPALPKAVYFLFLRHPEGIRFKDMIDYHDELLSIYRMMNSIGDSQRQMQSVREVTNPLSNRINEICARIKEAFVAQFDDRLARNYYIAGLRGEPKRISLQPSLIVWEQ